jgi:hypothetical protein
VRAVFYDFPPEADVLQRRMSLWLKPLAEEIWKLHDLMFWYSDVLISLLLIF